ncbi:MAG: hypothetical protein ACE5LF_00095 [Alphaproteobacteria bacterium]
MTSRRAANEQALLRELLVRIGGRGVNQRLLARELGVALGVINGYLKRCIADGLVEIAEKRGRRYRYALTPKGIAERARLEARYIRESLSLFRRVEDSFDRLYADLAARGVETAVLCGVDELTDIAVLCSLESGVRPVGVWRHAGRPTVVRGVPAIEMDDLGTADVVVVSVERNAQLVYHAVCRRVAPERVAVPDILDIAMSPAAAGGEG